jgi:hypothetical protein
MAADKPAVCIDDSRKSATCLRPKATDSGRHDTAGDRLATHNEPPELTQATEIRKPLKYRGFFTSTEFHRSPPMLWLWVRPRYPCALRRPSVTQISGHSSGLARAPHRVALSAEDFVTVDVQPHSRTGRSKRRN